VILFAVKNFNMTLQDVLDMSWAEFVLRSIGFREKREFDMMMTREISYEAHCMQYAFAKGKPPRKDKFWQIGEVKPQTSKLVPQAFLNARAEYKRKLAEND